MMECSNKYNVCNSNIPISLTITKPFPTPRWAQYSVSTVGRDRAWHL